MMFQELMLLLSSGTYMVAVTLVFAEITSPISIILNTAELLCNYN
jgi:hypothetical protein